MKETVRKVSETCSSLPSRFLKSQFWNFKKVTYRGATARGSAQGLITAPILERDRSVRWHRTNIPPSTRPKPPADLPKRGTLRGWTPRLWEQPRWRRDQSFLPAYPFASFTSREIDDSVRSPDYPCTSNVSTCSCSSDHRHFDSTKASYRAYESEERSGEKNYKRDSDYFED